MEGNQAQSRIVIWWVVFLVLAIILVAVWLVLRESEPPALNNLAAVGQLGEQSGDFEAGLEMADQVPGDLVYLSEVLVDGGAWVAIHEDYNGQPGTVLGAGYFDERVSLGAVDLGSATQVGQTYYAVLYHDSGADQRFNQAVEEPWLDRSGKAIVDAFQISGADDLEEDKG